MRRSMMLTALEGQAAERHSATFAKMASPSRSGSLGVVIINFETLGFKSFHF
jgi:hypothetical protein